MVAAAKPDWKTDRAVLRQAEERLRRATLEHDLVALRELLHDAFVLTGNRQTLTKEDVLAAHAEERLRLTRVEYIGEPEINVTGGIFGHVTVRVILEGTFEGTRCDGIYRYARTWQRVGSGWRVAAGEVEPEEKSALDAIIP